MRNCSGGYRRVINNYPAHVRDYEDEVGGNLIFGGSDPSLYEGEFDYVDVIPGNVEYDYWKIQIDRYDKSSTSVPDGTSMTVLKTLLRYATVTTFAFHCQG